MSRNIHDKPFDEATLLKLEILKEYTNTWLPTWLHLNFKKICIYDFMAGTGYDISKKAGSPIILLKVIYMFLETIRSNEVRIHLYFNEFNLVKFRKMKTACENFLEDNSDLKDYVEINYFNEDFANLFFKISPDSKSPSLLFIDQNGIKFMSKKYFNEIIKIKKTDFIYFISSSYFWRFGKSESFKNYIDIDMDVAKKDPYKFIHRHIVNYYRNIISDDNSVKLHPFSIKKGPNINGLIFGSSHIRGSEKFLNVVWSINPINGEANYDIDDENAYQTNWLEPIKKTRIEQFYLDLEDYIRINKTVNNKQIYYFTIESGYLIRHANDCLKNLRKNNKIMFPGHSNISWNGINNKVVFFKWI